MKRARKPRPARSRSGTFVERSGGNRWQTVARPGPGKPRNERLTENGEDARQTAARNCHAGGRGFESRRSRLVYPLNHANLLRTQRYRITVRRVVERLSERWPARDLPVPVDARCPCWRSSSSPLWFRPAWALFRHIPSA
jgi:hypothetical protein